MDQFQQELNELKGFIAELKEDRAATKAKEKRESWTKYVSLSLVIIAVIATIASQWAGKYGSRVLTQLNDATFNQTLASDQWAYYQAKSIKQKAYEIGRDQLKGAAATAEVKPELLKNYDDQITHYKNDQEDAYAKAHGLEKQRDAARLSASIASKKGGIMGTAILFYTVAITMASICMVTKRKPLWFIGMGLAAIGCYEMISAWLI